MNFDLGIATSYLTGIFLTSAAVASPAIDGSPSVAQPANGLWSNQYAQAVMNDPTGPNGQRAVLPNYQNKSPDKPNYFADPSLPPGLNFQISALYDFLSLYSVTRNNGIDQPYGWDDLKIANGDAVQKEAIRKALFGDGTAQGSLIQSVAVGGDKNVLIGNNNYGLTPNVYKQNPLDRIADVLSALGVPKNGGSHYWYKDHYNHFHLNIRPPTQTPVAIVASNNLTATGPVLADAGASGIVKLPATTKVKYDAAYSVCQAVVPTSNEDYDLANDLSPLTAAYGYFYKLGITPAVGPTNVTIIEGPSHGELSTKGLVLGAYRYIPNDGYLGPDQMTFVVEWMGKKIKVIGTVLVADIAPEYGGCPDYKLPPATTGNDKRGALDIIELPTDSMLDVEALAKLHSMVSFSMGAGMSGIGGSFNIADLSGAALGQTTGSTITLDTNAAGHNWFIDTTPADNSEFLPTSNPNEWVAKAGSAAAGKMDMLSVLLHEYGHALGINHSADPNDYMGTTLTAGVRRLPSAEEMALMQGLVAEAKATLSPTPLPQAVEGQSAPAFPTLPLGTSFIGFLGLLRSSRYGGVSIAADANTLVTQYAWAANTTLVNGSLNAADGWSTQGSVNIANGAAVMNEVSASQTRLSQVFLLNPTDRFLSFTLSGTALDDLTGAPDDAFEVALLDANTGASLLAGTGQTRSDAFLNLQADGTQNLADCVTCINNADGSRTYRVDLAGVPAGIAANLSFDLIGFGQNGSHVTVSDVRLSGLPQLHDETATMLEDGTLAFDPFAQVDNAAVLQLGSHVVDQPAHGAVSVNADGTFSYTPTADYFGTDTFTYRLSDGPLESNLATVSISLTAVNDAPVVADVQATTAEDTALVIALGAYATDVDSATLTTQIVTGPVHGVLTQNADGSYTYTPEANYNGADSFTYHVNDGALDSNIATVSLNVTSVNDAPTLGDLNLAAVEDTAQAMNLLAQAADVDGDTLTASIVAGAQHGQVSINADGSFTYTPDVNFNGTDSFTYKVNDGALDSRNQRDSNFSAKS